MTDHDPLDNWLRDHTPPVPPGFAERVMAQVDKLPLPAWPAVPMALQRPRTWLPWVAVIASAVLGAMQLAGFVFGIWAATAAA